MRVRIANGFGASVSEPSADAMRRFVRETDRTDEEHGAVWVATDDDAALEWNSDGRLVFDRDPGGVRHMLAVPLERVLALWLALAAGRLKDVDECDWRAGNGFVMTPDRQREIAASQRAQDRAFYDSLGAERRDMPCRSAGCARGAVAYSVLCRVHHFESIRQRPSPFED